MSNYKANTYAATLTAYLSAKYGHTYNLDEMDYDQLGSRVGLACENSDDEPSTESNEPTVRLFAFTGDSGEINELATGGRENLNQLINESMHNLPLGTRAVAVWSDATMRAIPNDLADDMAHGANPEMPTIAREIRERGRRVDCKNVLVIGPDAQVISMHTPYGTMTETAHDSDDQTQLGGTLPDAARALYAFAQWQNSIEQKVREQVAREKIEHHDDDLSEADKAAWSAWLAEWNEQEGDNNTNN